METSTAHKPSMAASLRRDEIVDEEGQVGEEIVEQVEDEYEMDHEHVITPAVLSPVSSPPVVEPASPPLRSALPLLVSPLSTAEKRQGETERVAVPLHETDDQHEMQTEQGNVIGAGHSNAVSWQADNVTATIEDSASTAPQAETEASQPQSTERELPAATTLSPTATGDFAVHKRHRSIGSSSDVPIDQHSYKPADLSLHSSLADQSVSNSRLSSASHPSNVTVATSQQLSPMAGETETRSTAIGEMLEALSKTGSSSTPSAEEMLASTPTDSGHESLSVSAIAVSAREETMNEQKDSNSALLDIDADFAGSSFSSAGSTTGEGSGPQRARTVVIEDEQEEEQEVVKAESKQPQDASSSPHSAAASTVTADTKHAPALPTRSVIPHDDLHQPPADTQPTATMTLASDQPTRNHDRSARLTAERPFASPGADAQRNPHHRPHQQPVTSRRPVSPQPLRPAAARTTVRANPSASQPPMFPFSTPSSHNHATYPLASALPRRSQHYLSLGRQPAHRMPAALSAPLPALPAPIAPSAPYVASKQALLQSIARHQHHRADRQLRAQQQQPQTTTPNSSTAHTTFDTTLSDSEIRQWQAERHRDERLARLLKVWQLNEHTQQRRVRVTRREQEEKEDVELEWLAREAEQRRLQERDSRHSKLRRPATPAAGLLRQAVPAWQEEDETSEVGSEEWTGQSQPSMVQLMENLRASARQEIAVQEAKRQGLR